MIVCRKGALVSPCRRISSYSLSNRRFSFHVHGPHYIANLLMFHSRAQVSPRGTTVSCQDGFVISVRMVLRDRVECLCLCGFACVSRAVSHLVDFSVGRVPSCLYRLSAAVAAADPLSACRLMSHSLRLCSVHGFYSMPSCQELVVFS